MTDTTNRADASSESDLAYLKRMASAGRGEPAPFLLLMAVFGGAYGLFALVISVATLAELFTGEGTPKIGAPIQQIASWGFAAASVAFICAALWTLWRTFGPQPIAVSRSAVAIWSAAFIGFLSVIGALMASATAPYAIFTADGLASALLILWGCAWWATGIASDRRWLLGVGLGSFVAAMALPIATPNFWGVPVLAACLLLLAFLPAVLLMRERRA